MSFESGVEEDKKAVSKLSGIEKKKVEIEIKGPMEGQNITPGGREIKKNKKG